MIAACPITGLLPGSVHMPHFQVTSSRLDTRLIWLRVMAAAPV